jgi:NAD(P)-dependent dehydrogenase (short-subunit alcohol dehydrogenase family)
MSAKETVVVTGGSAGIGEAIVSKLLGRGAHVICLDRHSPKIEHKNLWFVQADLADGDATTQAASEIASTHEVTGLVNNAGVNKLAILEEVTLEDIDYLTALHLKSPLLLTQAFLPAMKRASHGRIVNISTRAILGHTKRSVYAATKLGLVGYTRIWALELGKFGITVNAVAPGPIATEMFNAANPSGSPSRISAESKLAVGRLGKPADVAHAVCFLLANESAFITGQTLHVCGGASLGSVPV